MSEHNAMDAERQVSLGDLFRLLRSRKWLIVFCALFGLAFACFYALSRPIYYEAEATFLERGVRGGGSTGLSSLVGMLAGEIRSSHDSAVALMKSRKLWENLAYKFNLQGTIQENPTTHSLAQRALDHLRNEKAFWRGDARPPLHDRSGPLGFETLVYTSQLPLSLQISFSDHDTFHVIDPQSTEELVGHLGTLVETERYRFSLMPYDDTNLTGRSFTLRFAPIAQTTKTYIALVDLKTDDKLGVLRLTLQHPDRLLVSQLLNGLMDEYRDHLEKEQETLSSAQLAYLEKRKDDSFNSLQQMMQKYAFDLAQTIPQMGVIDAESELANLEKLKGANREQVALIDMELHRLRNQPASVAAGFMTRERGIAAPNSIEQSVNELSGLKQRRDRLLLLFSRDESVSAQLAMHLDKQVAALERCRSNAQQVGQLVMLLRSQQPLPSPSVLEIRDAPLVQTWYDRVWRESQRGADITAAKTDLLSYLDRHMRLAYVEQQHILEGLSHQSAPEPELEGIDLDTATKIYVSYVEQKNQTQADMRQNNLVMDQIKRPNFELGALSSLLKDPVSQRVIDSYAQLSMRVVDTAMRSPKEQERMKEEMERDRAFLIFHLQQSNELLGLREAFQNEKIRQVQAVMLSLIEQQISVTDRHLQDLVASHIEQLEQQKRFLTDVMQDINRQMSLLPQKWVADKMIKHQAKISSMIVEEVSKLVETKNISFHLEAIESAPLDVASTPLLPKRSNLVLYSLLGLVAGGLIGLCWSIASGLMQGIEVSAETLQQADQRVAGQIPKANRRRSPLSVQDPKHLALLRRLAGYLYTDPKAAKAALLLLGDGADYSESLATLLSKEGQRVMLVHVDFEQEADPSALPGLLQVLEGNASAPKVAHHDSYDSISTGGKSLFGFELLHHPRFQDFLSNLEQHYDRVLVAAPLSAASSEGLRMGQQFTRIAATLDHERWKDIIPYLRMSKQGSHVVYLLT